VIDYPAVMTRLRARPIGPRVEPTEDVIAEFERRFEVALPADYRAFLTQHGSMRVDATVEFLEPTPLGTTTHVDVFFGFDPDPKSANDLERATRIADGAGTVIPIASSERGDWYFLDCREDRRGRVLLRDFEQRHLWTAQHALTRYPNLAPSLSEHFGRSDRGELPPPRSGTPGWYLMGDSFDAFLLRLVPRNRADVPR
jgi:hypothetical protein